MKINVLVSNYFHGVRVIVEFGTTVAKYGSTEKLTESCLARSTCSPHIAGSKPDVRSEGFPGEVCSCVPDRPPGEE